MSRHAYSLLFSLVIFSVVSTPIAWALCPYMNGAHEESTPAKSDERVESEASHCSQKKSHFAKQVVRIYLPSGRPAIAPIRDECSHCMMHSRSDANATSKVAIINSPTDHSITPDLVVGAFTDQNSNRALVDVHEHGPPGSQDHRYILNSTFRI